MILMRLVWMQLRSYPVFLEGRAADTLAALGYTEVDACGSSPELDKDLALPVTAEATEKAARAWIVSPGYGAAVALGCEAKLFEERPLVKLNQVLFAATVLLAVMLTRFNTSSWTVALIVAAMLMSRGRLLADLGQVSIDFTAAFVVTAWLAAATHYLRSGAWASLLAAMGVTLYGTLVDRSLAALALAPPVMLGVGYLYRKRLAGPVLQRLRGSRQRVSPVVYSTKPRWEREGTTYVGRAVTSARWLLGMEFPDPDAPAPQKIGEQRGSLFRTLNAPFLLWVYARKRWLRLGGGWLATGLLAAAASFAVFWTLAEAPGSILAPVSAGLKAQLPEIATAWRVGILGRFDLHLMLSLFVVLFAAAQSPASGLAAFLESTWLTLLSVLLVGGAAFALDAFDLTLASATLEQAAGAPLLPRAVALWFEPVFLTLGASGIYNLMKVLDTRIAERS